MATEWNHIEASLAYANKLPLLVIHHLEVTRGIFDRGIMNAFIHCIDLKKPNWSMAESINGVIKKWKTDCLANNTHSTLGVESSAESGKCRKISGIWVCQYSYPKLDDRLEKKVRAIETQIVRFKQSGSLVKGSTIYAKAHPEDFEGRVTKDRFFTGLYFNQKNHHSYHGAFQFVISNSHNRMLGKWVGFNREGSDVDAEEWRWLQLDDNPEISKEKEHKYITKASSYDLFSTAPFL